MNCVQHGCLNPGAQFCLEGMAPGPWGPIAVHGAGRVGASLQGLILTDKIQSASLPVFIFPDKQVILAIFLGFFFYTVVSVFNVW